MEKKGKSKSKSKAPDGRKNLSSVRVIQRNLVYIVGLPLTLADEDVCISPLFLASFCLYFSARFFITCIYIVLCSSYKERNTLLNMGRCLKCQSLVRQLGPFNNFQIALVVCKCFFF